MPFLKILRRSYVKLKTSMQCKICEMACFNETNIDGAATQKQTLYNICTKNT